MKAGCLLKLLVVDDHAAFRSTVRQMFEDCAVVTEAGSGEEALQEYAAEVPDWIIMDLRMPGMGGLKAAQAIHELDPQARVILISEFTEPELAEAARRAGAMALVNKEDITRVAEFIRG